MSASRVKYSAQVIQPRRASALTRSVTSAVSWALFVVIGRTLPNRALPVNRVERLDLDAAPVQLVVDRAQPVVRHQRLLDRLRVVEHSYRVLAVQPQQVVLAGEAQILDRAVHSHDQGRSSAES